jgi:hypothetical protein
LADCIRVIMPGKGSQEYYFSLQPDPVDFHVLKIKFMAALISQFYSQDFSILVFYWLFNPFLLGSAAFVVKALRMPQGNEMRRLAFCVCVAAAAHGIFVVLHASQFRENFVFLSLHISCTVAFLAVSLRFIRIKAPIRIAGIFLILLGFLAIDGTCIRKFRSDIADFNSEQKSLAANMSLIPVGDRVIAEVNERQVGPISFSTYPRITLLLLNRNPYSSESYRILQDDFKGKWLICSSDSSLPKLFHAEKVELNTPLVLRFKQFSLYKIPVP